jgi:hypothetical protein
MSERERDAKPRLSYRITLHGPHTSLTIWLDGANIGTVTVDNDQRWALDMLAATLIVNKAKEVPHE